jgi:hypothetical protein
LTQGGAWTNSSDRNGKTNFQPVQGDELLRRLDAIPITTWNYKAEPDAIRHLGPMAQDFYEAFRLGEDDKHISTIDEGGVALAAVQALYHENQRQQAALDEQQRQIAELTGQLRVTQEHEAKLEQQQQEIETLARELREVRSHIESAPAASQPVTTSYHW